MVKRSSVGGERPVVVAVSHVGTEAAEAGHDRLSRLRMHAELARQLEQLQRFVQRDGRFGQAVGERRSLGLVLRSLLRRFAQLHVRAEAAVDGVDVHAGVSDRRRACRGPSAFARISAIAFSTVRSAGACVGGSDAVLPGPPSPICRNGP